MNQSGENVYDDDDYDDMEEFSELIDLEDYLGGLPDCSNGQYTLGTVSREPFCDLILDNRVDIRIFYRFEYRLVEEWTFTPYYLPGYHFSDKLEIIQVIIKDDVYTAVIKTFWLREFQRACRKRMHWIKLVKKNILSFMTRRAIGILNTATYNPSTASLERPASLRSLEPFISFIKSH
jgi:hypothetical protein